MWIIILVSLGLLLLGFLLLGYISPYQGNKTNFFQIQEKEVKYLFETSNIQQYKLTDEDKEWIEADLVKDDEEWDEDHVLDQILNEIVEDIPEEKDKIEIEQEIKIDETLEKEIRIFNWKNIGLELYKETNLELFFEKLNSLKNKRILIVTDVSYVLEADFKDHRVFIGFLKDFEILDDNTQDQPRIKFKIDIPVFNISLDLNWIYDKNKFDSDFSSEELVSNFLETLKPVNELLLVEE
jgi:hypothetical protein